MSTISNDANPFVGLPVANGERLEWGRRTYVMGVINVTPDSFSGDGLAGDIPGIVDLALRYQDEGADILDVGAESTRPGHKSVPEEEELSRLLPALEAIASRVTLPISVDTYKSRVAEQALLTGAAIVNDIWGLKPGPEMAQVVAGAGAGLVLMHNQRGSEYGDLMDDIVGSLERSVAVAAQAGVSREAIVIDPGIGFGKTPDQNIELLQNLGRLKALGLPLLIGVSRKSTLGLLLGLPPDQRVEGTAAAVALAIAGGADMVRVHDVRQMARVCRVSDALVRGWRPFGWNGNG